MLQSKPLQGTCEAQRMLAALQEIERKYATIMKEPPAWVDMTQKELTTAREAWYGATDG